MSHGVTAEVHHCDWKYSSAPASACIQLHPAAEQLHPAAEQLQNSSSHFNLHQRRDVKKVACGLFLPAVGVRSTFILPTAASRSSSANQVWGFSSTRKESVNGSEMIAGASCCL